MQQHVNSYIYWKKNNYTEEMEFDPESNTCPILELSIECDTIDEFSKTKIKT